MVKNMFFLDSEHVGMGKSPPPAPPSIPPKVACLFMLDAWFQNIILLGYDLLGLLQLLLDMWPKLTYKMLYNSKDSV